MWMAPDEPPSWSFLTNHAQVLLCIAHDPSIRLREIGDAVGITERAAHRIVVELAAAGYISRERIGRRNRYTIEPHLPLPDPLARGQRVGDLLAILSRGNSEGTGTGRDGDAAERQVIHAAAARPTST
jgi:DNA-binding Lrp family transcriptional regulator